MAKLPRSHTPARLILLALAAAVFVLAWFLLEVPPLSVLREWAESTGAWFPLLFWLLYVAITQFPVPRTILTLSAGILFGTLDGIIIAITATTVSAIISLLVVRTLLRDWIEPRLTHPTVRMINSRLEQRGWLAVTSLRMIAVVPFSILNYAAALTRVGVWQFAFATFLGSLPGTIITVLFGDTLTGQANPVTVVATVVLAVVGIAGLLVDAAVPTRQRPHPSE